MDKRLLINVQGGRKVTGLLRGFDIFLNLVLDDCRDETYPGMEEPMEGGSTVSS
jgi:small nuclear ribonucleoprotein (snRNP)-like protein